jgi:hypothetical protein
VRQILTLNSTWLSLTITIYIPNLKLLNTPHEYKVPPFQTLEPTVQNQGAILHLIHLFKKVQRHSLMFRVDQDTFAVNMWIDPIYNTLKPKHDIECHPIHLYNIMREVVEMINQTTLLRLKFPIDAIADIQKLPSLSDVSLPDQVTSFIQKVVQEQKCIFYYNFYSKSGDLSPIRTQEEHNKVIQLLSERFKDHYIIVPTSDGYSYESNVICCDRLLGFKQDPSCENITYLAIIADACDVSVHFTIGACFYYMNRNIADPKSNKKKILIYKDRSYYYETHIEIIKSLKGTTELLNMGQCYTVEDVCQRLPSTISAIY